MHASAGFVSLYRTTLEHLGWTVTVSRDRLGNATLLLERFPNALTPDRPLLERRAERALVRMPALEPQPMRIALILTVFGVVDAITSLGIGTLLLLDGDATCCRCSSL